MIFCVRACDGISASCGCFWQGSHFRLILRLQCLPFALQVDLLLQPSGWSSLRTPLQVDSCFRIVSPSLFTYLPSTVSADLDENGPPVMNQIARGGFTARPHRRRTPGCRMPHGIAACRSTWRTMSGSPNARSICLRESRVESVKVEAGCSCCHGQRLQRARGGDTYCSRIGLSVVWGGGFYTPRESSRKFLLTTDLQHPEPPAVYSRETRETERRGAGARGLAHVNIALGARVYKENIKCDV